MSTDVTHNPDESRYEIHVDGTLAGYTVAEQRDGVVVFPHTVVFDEFEGKGLAGTLVSGALDDVRERGLKIEAVCPYVARYVAKHDQYADLVA